MPSAKKPSLPKHRAAVKPVPVPPKPAPAPLQRFLVRCTFVGEDKKQQVNGSFRFLLEAVGTSAVLPKLGKAVNKLRRARELPPRCDVYVEFILELAELERGVVADFERWEVVPRRFQHGSITFSETCGIYHHEHPEPAFRFGKTAAQPAAIPAALSSPHP